MSDTKTPQTEEKTNHIGLTKEAYGGLPSTLCAGCGHDSITRHIISAFYEMGIKPHNVIKLSGIGCSSKTPAYFMSKAHGFNSVHGRMPSVTTGAILANRTLEAIGVSGDGDTASIGMGQFVHMIRRNVDCTYIVENNGVYGLTKGQFSATADPGSVLKKGETNDYPDIDLCSMAILLGCNYVGRSFSGDMNQMVPMIQGGIAHRGTAMLDVISPCVTFNNHEGSTKSFLNVKKNDIAIHEIGFHPYFETPEVDLKHGEERQVELPDGSVISLKKVSQDHDPTNATEALNMINESKAKGQILTGLLYANPKANVSFRERLKMVDKPLAYQTEDECRISKEDFEKLQRRLR
ncbi:2-oxoacid:ferredoxin oxidoreductase subunit beta [bacterium]|nr:2-oxoacid:ferredoxin oxidoreductase subunit beta [bacterium]